MTIMERVIMALFVILLFGAFLSLAECVNTVHQAGGYKNMIIEAGKEIKDIAREINEH